MPSLFGNVEPSNPDNSSSLVPSNTGVATLVFAGASA